MDASQIFVVDADSHVTEPPRFWQDYLEEKYRQRAPRPVLDENGTYCYVVGGALVARTASRLGSKLEASPDERSPVKLLRGGWDPAARLVDMDREGIDIAVIYPSVALFLPEVSDDVLQAALCRAYNNWLADYCKEAPGRLIGIAALPLNDVETSIRELERCTQQLGFRGAFVRPNPYGGRPIQHPANEPFWQCAESLGIPVTVHEGLSDTIPTLGRDRSESPVLQHLMSHPFEQMAACGGLILGGVLERHPDLRFVFLESGCGWLPYWIERLDGHFANWGRHLQGVKLKPSDYFRRQCFISMDPDDVLAPSVLQRMGDDCMVWASDYPHPDHKLEGCVQETIEILSSAGESSTRKVLGMNAFRLYNMEPPPQARA